MKLRRLILVGLNIVLLAGFWPLLRQETRPADRAQPSATRTSPEIGAAVVAANALPDVARSLFGTRSDRDEPADIPSPHDLNLRFIGAALADRLKFALVERDGSVFQVKEGDEIEGWEVTAIAPRAIQFTRARQRINVLLDAPPDPL